MTYYITFGSSEHVTLLLFHPLKEVRITCGSVTERFATGSGSAKENAVDTD